MDLFGQAGSSNICFLSFRTPWYGGMLICRERKKLKKTIGVVVRGCHGWPKARVDYPGQRKHLGSDG